MQEEMHGVGLLGHREQRWGLSTENLGLEVGLAKARTPEDCGLSPIPPRLLLGYFRLFLPVDFYLFTQCLEGKPFGSAQHTDDLAYRTFRSLKPGWRMAFSSFLQMILP